MSKKLICAFTLIELLVVVSIIGILTTLLFANLNTARERGRDTQRKSDIRNMQTALRLYYNDKAKFPAGDSDYRILGCDPGGTSYCEWGGEWSVGTIVYMSTLPKDPQGQTDTGINVYRYISTGDDDYTLRACFENKSDDKGKTTSETSWCPSGWMYEVEP
jgi:prepilin-type N-terminal cleavage/methylation domain-containing protein